MADSKSTTSQFQRDIASSMALAQVAKHLYLACASWVPDLPRIESEDAAAMLLDAKYRAAGAHRRGMFSCRFVLVERIAATLAIADGVPWPACGGRIALDTPDTTYEAICAHRRQRYRHVAGLVVAEVNRYLEQGTDTEAERQIVIADAKAQREADTGKMARAGNGHLASTVTHIKKGGE